MAIKNPNTDTVYDMDLHDTLQVTDSVYATRVPGGWIYENATSNGTGGYDCTACFVPFNNEFQCS